GWFGGLGGVPQGLAMERTPRAPRQRARPTLRTPRTRATAISFTSLPPRRGRHTSNRRPAGRCWWRQEAPPARPPPAGGGAGARRGRGGGRAALGNGHQGGPKPPLLDGIAGLDHLSRGPRRHIGALDFHHRLVQVGIEWLVEWIDALDAVTLEHVQELALGH